MKSLRYLHLDVFTERPLEGNQLAVFTDGVGLDARVMQQIAREMAFPESTFLLPKEDLSTDVRMRIFTLSRELPMAGHPTVGSTFALAHTGVIKPGQERFVFGLGVGPTRVDLRPATGSRSRGCISSARPSAIPSATSMAWPERSASIRARCSQACPFTSFRAACRS